jgi:cobalt-zinc-cadmium efflux system membrane fusion protein
MRFFSIIGLLLALICATGCGQSKPQAEVPAETTKAPSTPPSAIHLSETEMKLGSVVLGKASERVMAGGLKVNGLLDVPPEQLIAITAPLGGVVVRTTLVQGQLVHAGDVIATIRNSAFIQLQQDYLEIQGKLGFAKQELQRQQDLVKDEVAPIKNLQRAQADFAALQAQAVGQAARLRMAGLPVGTHELVSEATLRAPKNAYVRDVFATVGQSLTPTDPICTLVDPSHMHVELTVFEKDAPELYVGQPIRFALPNQQMQDTERKATIYLIGRTVDPAQRTVRVHGHLEKEDENDLLPGMFVRATIETTKKRTTVLPEAAVVDFEGKDFVFALNQTTKGNTSFDILEVRTGARAEGFVEVALPKKVVSKQFAVAGAYSILSKLKNAKEED